MRLTALAKVYNFLVTTTSAAEGLERRILRRISLVMRALVVLSWSTVLEIVVSHNVSKTLALGAFTAFRIIAIVGALWLIAELAEGLAGRIRLFNLVVDCVLILPMFVFWLIVAASTF